MGDQLTRRSAEEGRGEGAVEKSTVKTAPRRTSAARETGRNPLPRPCCCPGAAPPHPARSSPSGAGPATRRARAPSCPPSVVRASRPPAATPPPAGSAAARPRPACAPGVRRASALLSPDRPPPPAVTTAPPAMRGAVAHLNHLSLAGSAKPPRQSPTVGVRSRRLRQEKGQSGDGLVGGSDPYLA